MRKWIIKYLARTALAGGLAMLLAAIWFITPPGQRSALRLVSWAASSSESGIRFGALEGSLLSNGRIGSITLSDGNGTWLEIQELSFSWSPLALFTGRLHIETLAANTVSVLRPPEPSKKKASGSTSAVPLLRLTLAHFEIGEIDVAESIAGERLRLHAEAKAHLVDPSKGLSAHLALRRLDGPGGTASVRLAYRPESQDLDLTVAASEPGNGIAARLLDLDGASLDLAFDGSGPLAAWRATWTLAASGTPFVAGNAAIDERGGGYDIAASFEGYLTPLAPRMAAALFAGKTTGTFAGHWSEGEFEIERVALTSDALDVGANGGIDTVSGMLFGDVTARVHRADSEPLTFTDGEGEPFVLGHADARLTAPRSTTSRTVAITMSASGLAQSDRTLDKIDIQATALQRDAALPRVDDIAMRIGALGLRQSPEDEPIQLDLEITGAAAPDRLDLAFATDGLAGTLDGTLSSGALSVDLTARLADLARLAPVLTGAATLEGRLRGTPDDLAIDISLAGEDITLHGHAVEDPQATLTARDVTGALSGTLDARASIAGQPLRAHSQIARPSEGALAFEKIALSLGAIQVAGDLAMGSAPLPAGRMTIDAPSLAALGAVVGEAVEGGLTAALVLSDTPGEPALAFQAEAETVRYGDTRLNALKATGRFEELLESITGEAELTVSSVSGGVDARDIRLTAHGLGPSVAVAMTGSANGIALALDGTISETEAGHDLALGKITLRKESFAAWLAEPARIALRNGDAHIEKLTLSIGSGRVDISGRAGAKHLDLSTRITSLPASLADAFVPDVGLSGTIEGTIDVSGTPADPSATARAAWRNASAAATRNALPPVTVGVTAKLANDRVSGEIETSGPDNLKLTAQGALDLSPGGALDAALTGDIPLALANASLADRAARLTGRAGLSGRISGTIATPSLSATIDIPDAAVRDPASGLNLTPMTARIFMTERGAVIERLEATSEQGGTLSGTGEITLAQEGGPPNIRIALDVSTLRFDDRNLMAGELDGRFEIRGTPDDLAASGAIRLTRLDVTVPNALPRSISSLDIRHVNAPPHLASSEKADASGARDETGSSRIALDVQLDAANRIFVQGRGLDVQLGGTLRLGGTAAYPIANGAFSMERGRLAILGRQLDFRRGNINFYGSLEPLLDMEAAAQAGDITVIVSVTGSSADPKFAFSSVPALPEDEVVARLLYNKDLAGLSPMQLAQLASEIDKIGGLSSGPGVLDKLKASVGVDVLDIGTDSEGAATVSAGSYVSESTYVGVRQGTAAGSSQVVIDHDLTKNLKARGELGADGESKIGIGFEWDY